MQLGIYGKPAKKKMTEKVVKSSKDFKRNPKHKNDDRSDEYNWYPDNN